MAANNAPFMNKDIRKLKMLRSKAKRELNKNKTVSNRERYKKVRNRCVKLIRRTKRRYFKNLDVKFVNDDNYPMTTMITMITMITFGKLSSLY